MITIDSTRKVLQIVSDDPWIEIKEVVVVVEFVDISKARAF